MTDEAVPLTPVTLTPEQRAEAIENASHITASLIGELKPYLPTLLPAKDFAAMNFDIVRRYVNALSIYRDEPIDCSTPSSLKAAKEIRYTLRTLRTTAESLRLEANRPFMERIEANNDEKKIIEDMILPIEKRFDDAIKAEAVAAAERKRKEEEAEAARNAAVSSAIAAINGKSNLPAEATSAEIEAAVIDLMSDKLDGDFFGSRMGEAGVAKDQTLFRMQERFKQAQANEERAAQIKAQAETIERQQREHAEAMARRDAEDKAREAAERAKRATDEKERREAGRVQSIRDSITGIGLSVSRFITAPSKAIKTHIEYLESLLVADFEPLAREAGETIDASLQALRSLLPAAEDRERTERERQERRERAEAIDERITLTEKIFSMCRASNDTADMIDIEVAALEAQAIDEANFGDRVEEARGVYAEQIKHLRDLSTSRREAENIAAEEKAVSDRKAAEQAAEQAKRSRLTRALAEECVRMHEALSSVAADAAFSSLEQATRVKVLRPLSAIVAAQEGGAA